MDAARHARNLLQLIRETPLQRFGRKHPLEALRDRIASTIAAEDVLSPVATGVATQLVVKIDKASIGGATTWRAIGRQLVDETSRLRERMALVDRQIIIVLPKLGAEAVRDLYEWLAREEPTVARTILNAAISASVPREMAERYLAQYRQVVASLLHVEPQLARTIANGTFMAKHPIEQAKRHLERFEKLLREFDGTDVPA